DEVLVDAIERLVALRRLRVDRRRADLGPGGLADARAIAVLDREFAAGGKGLGPEEARLQRPVGREVMLPALADVVIVGDCDVLLDQRVLVRRFQRVERLSGRFALRR